MATVVEGDPKGPFSIATTQRYRGGYYSFLWIASLYMHIHIYIHTHIYIYIYTRACAHTHTHIYIYIRTHEVFQATFYIGTVLLYIGSCWSPILCSSICRGAQEYIAYELLLTSPAVSRKSGSSNLDSFRDGW